MNVGDREGSMNKSQYVVLAITIIVGVARFIVPVQGPDVGDLFKDFAHLFVGGLIGAACTSSSKKFYIYSAVGISVLELVAAFARS